MEVEEMTTVQPSVKRSNVTVSSQAFSGCSDSFDEIESNSSSVENYGYLDQGYSDAHAGVQQSEQFAFGSTDEMGDSSEVESCEEVDDSTFLVPLMKVSTIDYFLPPASIMPNPYDVSIYIVCPNGEGRIL